MDKFYYDAVDSMEKHGVDREYINGWMSGYFHHPKRGPQHVTEAYEAGYEDGFNKVTDHSSGWQKVA